jgi:uncharacterized Zn finger protein
MKSITENSVEIEPKMTEKVITLAKKLGGSKNEKVKKLFGESGVELTPKAVNALTDSEIVGKLYSEMEKIEKENK